MHFAPRSAREGRAFKNSGTSESTEVRRLSVDGNASEGFILLVDKPYGWTSFDVVNKLRRIRSLGKVGHAGTLDPLATGLLIVCTGNRTKSIGEFVSLEKTYTGTLVLGARTPSRDRETIVNERKSFPELPRDHLNRVAENFVGHIEQIPPMYSALKYGGQALYTLARKGKKVPRIAREVEIHEFEISGYAAPVAFFTVRCSKGTYIRTLVDDFGQAVGCGAYLHSLRRTRIGRYSVHEALSIPETLTHIQQALHVVS